MNELFTILLGAVVGFFVFRNLDKAIPEEKILPKDMIVIDITGIQSQMSTPKESEIPSIIIPKVGRETMESLTVLEEGFAGLGELDRAFQKAQAVEANFTETRLTAQIDRVFG